ncbi:MAG: hypothetical protein HQK53_05190 [Oligoflexia bacterium]|nr:hypothetical protein [Oligoflexia bacterium]
MRSFQKKVMWIIVSFLSLNSYGGNIPDLGTMLGIYKLYKSNPNSVPVKCPPKIMITERCTFDELHINNPDDPYFVFYKFEHIGRGKVQNFINNKLEYDSLTTYVETNGSNTITNNSRQYERKYDEWYTGEIKLTIQEDTLSYIDKFVWDKSPDKTVINYDCIYKKF